MNEYLSKPGCQWGDAGFTDVFPPDVRDAYYRDTPLSPLGIQQAERLSRRLGNLVGQRSAGADVDMNLSLQDQNILNDLELIAVSPLTRALQTLELGLIPHVLHKKNPLNASPQKIKDDGSLLPMDENNTNEKGTMPKVVALPLASERVYLISDAGNSPATLAKQFPYVDFESEMMVRNKEEWWFTPENEDNYVEWRPIGQGQRYASYGEPDGEFQGRMTKLYDWLDARPESTIALICHWGVINWLLGHDFENCEMKVVSFDALRRQGFQSPL
jgi:broad specificity phosphatase PhoE